MGNTDSKHNENLKNAIILAAGFGMRMVPINTEIPKGLLKVNDEPLVERLIKQLREVAVTDIYIRPFLFLLRRLEAVDGQDAEIIILPSFGVRSGELTLMSLKNIKPVSGLWRWLFG